MTTLNNNSLGWINGTWGAPNKLLIPICDRGLTLGDGLFETILIYKGVPKLLESHLNRMRKGASILKMDAPPTEGWLRPLIAEGITRAALQNNNGVLRLNWSRGDNLDRGINLSNAQTSDSQHRFWLEIHSAEPSFQSISSIVSRHERRNSYSNLCHCKIFSYNQSIQARMEANLAGFDEALLLSHSGEICCGTTANLLVHRHNQWLTPRFQSGCLQGIMRQQGINTGMVKEAKINKTPEEGDEWLLINSLGCHPIHTLDQYSLSVSSNPKKLWLSLID